MDLGRRYFGLVPLVAALLIGNIATQSFADESSWQDLKPDVFGSRKILSGEGLITLRSPYRATDDRKVPVGVDVSLRDGRQIKSITVILDENPMPVSAVYKLQHARSHMSVAANMRLNGPTKVRAIVETSDGKLYMVEKFIKTSGLGACAAPPVGDPKKAIATLGQMNVKFLAMKRAGKKARLTRAVRLKIKHPNLTGMQMDQITLHYIPARYVKNINVSHGNRPLFTLTASISLGEDPELEFDYPLGFGSGDLTVRIEDTDGAMFQKRFPAPPAG